MDIGVLATSLEPIMMLLQSVAPEANDDDTKCHRLHTNSAVAGASPPLIRLLVFFFFFIILLQHQ
jgi:hypothetical protein